ncbi:unnamed protein product [Didymodactylos carnosus]|uniref:NHL repeat containing protein n=1 Tax=Didymodactylos carnosus TaxID=1234261 RepID=A0A8S2KSH1_9BILA|nr:unnamed protein product [Didymodactylos carnosus]CAF3852207.1 unnamed protein product [Didymodactylos carnosus]
MAVPNGQLLNVAVPYTAIASSLQGAWGTTVDHYSNVYVAYATSVKKYPGGTLVAGGTGGLASPGAAYGIFVDCFGAIYVTDHAYHRIQLWANSSVGVTIIGSQNGTSGTGPNDLDGPIDVKLDQQSNIYVLDTNNNRIQKYPPGGGTGSTIGTLPSNSGANALFVDGCGNFYISQTSGVYQFTQVSGSGTLIPLTFTGSPSGIAFDAQMNLYINVNNVTAGTTYKYAYI